MLTTDAQVHIWEPETPDRPWLDIGRSFAHGDQFTADRLLAEMDATGVDRAVLVPPSFEGDRNETCLAAAAAHPERLAVMGRITLADPASRGRMAGWRDQPGMLGVRVTFSRGDSVRWLSDGTADWFWPEAEAAGIPVMLFAPDLLPEVDRIARDHPRLRLVLDHLAIRTDCKDDEIDATIKQVVGLAGHENLAVKASCLPSNVTEGYPFRSLHPRIRTVLDAFGPRRTFWGSDLTRLPCTYREVRDLFMCELDFLSEEDLKWIMGRGVGEWLQWPEAR